MTIMRFRGFYNFLSNMFECSVTWEGLTYTCAESAFQSAKVLDLNDRIRFTKMDGVTAKNEGNKVKLREDWDSVKFNIMYEIVKAKFTQNHHLRNKLVETEDELIVEGNPYNDKFYENFGFKEGNVLGKIIMRVRDEINRGLY